MLHKCVGRQSSVTKEVYHNDCHPNICLSSLSKKNKYNITLPLADHRLALLWEWLFFLCYPKIKHKNC